MPLQVYNKTDPPISVVVDNDTYFDGHTELDSGDMCAGVLKVIDKAVYNSPATFIGRDTSLGALYKQHLSTGTKTLLKSDNIDIVWDGKHFTKLSELKRYLSEVM